MRRTAVANKTQTSKALRVVKELDAFPKVPDNFKETTAAGGGVSLLTFVFIGILMISEFNYYRNSKLKFDYEVDSQVDGKIKINIDMTIAMRCEYIGADALDQTGQDTQSFGSLTMDNTHFALSERQRMHQKLSQEVNNYLRNEYHAIQELIWLSGHNLAQNFGIRDSDAAPSKGPPDACRVHGFLEVNKVAGNFHITAGKSVPVFPRGHIHLSMQNAADYNFTHRIDHFSFGDASVGVVNPLDGEEQVTENNYHLFQYFMKIVPTKIQTFSQDADTYQYSVTERSRPINHSGGSHGVPGIFVKYDLFPFKICVREEYQPFTQFLIRLCGIVGGIFVVSGLLHRSTGVIVDVLCCRFRLGKYSSDNSKSGQLLEKPQHADGSLTAQESNTLYTNNSGYSESFNPVHLAEQNRTTPIINNSGDDSGGAIIDTTIIDNSSEMYNGNLGR